jgi:hypothetical protein
VIKVVILWEHRRRNWDKDRIQVEFTRIIFLLSLKGMSRSRIFGNKRIFALNGIQNKENLPVMGVSIFTEVTKMFLDA